MAEHFDKLVDLLPLARHRRDQRLPGVGHAQVGEERPAQVEEAMLLTVMLGRWRLAQLLRLAPEQRAFVLLAVFQLGFVGQRQQVRVLERARQQRGNRRHAVGQRQVLGDVAGLVAVDEGQARLLLDRHCLDDQPLQLGFVTDVFGQHQLDKGVLRNACAQQFDELGVMIRRGAGRLSGNGHEQKRLGQGMPGILGGMGVQGTGLFDQWSAQIQMWEGACPR